MLARDASNLGLSSWPSLNSALIERACSGAKRTTTSAGTKALRRASPVCWTGPLSTIFSNMIESILRFVRKPLPKLREFCTASRSSSVENLSDSNLGGPKSPLESSTPKMRAFWFSSLANSKANSSTVMIS